MCGIVGLFFKRGFAVPTLGRFLAGMLSQMAERGPDSTGFALYGDAAPGGTFKATLHAPNAEYDWTALEAELSAAFPPAYPVRCYGSQAVFTIGADQWRFFSWLTHRHPELVTFGFGERIEVFKDIGLPDAVAQRFSLEHRSGTHALGHTRMATESAVTTEDSHPFSTGLDLCLVHNGSLSNHNPRTISLIDLPLTKCSRRIRPIVSTTSIPRHPTRVPQAGSLCNSSQRGSKLTPITPSTGVNLPRRNTVEKGADLGVDLGAQPADLALGNPGHAHGLDQLVDRTGGHALT